jgi:hypothetical protein
MDGAETAILMIGITLSVTFIPPLNRITIPKIMETNPPTRVGLAVAQHQNVPSALSV